MRKRSVFGILSIFFIGSVIFMGRRPIYQPNGIVQDDLRHEELVYSDDLLKAESLLINLPDYCSSFGQNIPVIFFVPIRTESFELRNVIRRTWGGVIKDDLKRPFLFLLSLYPDQRAAEAEVVQAQVTAEAKIYRDILQFPFLDDYTTLVIKTYGMLWWTQKYCPQAQYIFKADDDVILSPRVIVDYVEKTNLTRTIFGHPRYDPVHRPFFPESVYKPEYYPPWVSGFSYLMTTDAIDDLLRVARTTGPHMFLEDTAMSGFWAPLANVKKRYDPELFAYCTQDRCTIPRSMSTFLFTKQSQLEAIWENVTKINETECPIMENIC